MAVAVFLDMQAIECQSDIRERQAGRMAAVVVVPIASLTPKKAQRGSGTVSPGYGPL